MNTSVKLNSQTNTRFASDQQKYNKHEFENMLFFVVGDGEEVYCPVEADVH